MKIISVNYINVSSKKNIKDTYVINDLFKKLFINNWYKDINQYNYYIVIIYGFGNLIGL